MATILRGETIVAPTVVLRRHIARSRAPYVLVAGAVAAIVAAIAVAATGGNNQPRVVPVQHGASAAAQAHNLELWLQRYSR
jgi:hypothetical protein